MNLDALLGKCWERDQSWRKMLRVVCAALLMALIAVSIDAQSFTGSISGMAKDQAGAVIPNATVTLTAVETGQTRTTTTNAQGEYNFPSLSPGNYKLKITGDGFTTREITAQLSVSQHLRADTQLSVGPAAETVNISAGADGIAIEREHAQLSNMVTQRQITELPLMTRNPYDLIALSAGVTDSPDRNTSNTGTQRGAGFAVNGQRSQSANFVLDGGENNDTFQGKSGQNVPLDAIQEFRVQTSNYTSEYGRGSGYVANVVTKAGGNQFHGSVYEFNRHSKLAANDSFNNANGFAKSFFNRNQFGFSGGGPVIKDKTFFFGSSEWIKVRSSVSTGFFVPTPQLLAASSAATNSVFSKFPAPIITGRTVTAGNLGLTALTNASGAPIAANTPLFGRVSIPLPRDAGAGVPQNTFLSTGRVDHNFSDRTTLFGRYAYEREEDSLGSQSFSPYQGFSTINKNRNQNLTLQLTHVWSSRVVTESRVVYNRLLNAQPLGQAPVTPTFALTSINSSQQDGAVVLPGYYSAPGFIGGVLPFGGPQNLYQSYTAVNYQRTKHSFKFGAQYVHIRDNRTFGAFENALADFGSVQNFINGALQTYRIAVDPKGKFPGEVIPTPFTAPNFTRHYRYNEVAWFAQDTYQITPRLTLSAGLRWEYFGVLHSPDNEKALDANFYVGAGSTRLEQLANGRFDLTINRAGDLKNHFYAPDYNNLAPRIGLAYDLSGNGKTVLRAGYGIFYDRNFGNVLFNLIQNPPNYASLTLGAGVGVPITANTDQFAALAAVAGRSYTSSARAVDERLRTAYANVWNVNLQHELRNSYVVSLAYAGSNGIKLYSLNNVNRSGSGVLLGRGGRLNTAVSDINFRSNDGHSNYHSLQARVDSRYIKSAGLQFSAAYTWSHAIDNESATFGDSYLLRTVGLGVSGFQDAFNPAGDKGSADFDVRHRFVTSFNWDMPLARKLSNGWLKHALDGWAMNGMMSFRTGAPFTVFDTSQANNNGQQPIRPTVTGAVSNVSSSPRPTAGQGGAFDYLALTGLSATPSVNGPFIGTLGRNTFRAPGMQMWNVSFFRNIKLTETKKLQFRAEFFNLFNHANLFVAGGTNNMAASNTVRVTRGGLFDNIGNAEQHRNVQLALKFLF